MNCIKKIVRKLPPFHNIFGKIEKNEADIKKLEKLLQTVQEELEKTKGENVQLRNTLEMYDKKAENLQIIIENLEKQTRNRTETLEKQIQEWHALMDKRNLDTHNLIVEKHRECCEKIEVQNRNQEKNARFQNSVKEKIAATDRVLLKMKNDIKENAARIIINHNDIYSSKYAIYHGKKREKKIIVALTSYGERIRTVHYTIRSLLLQTLKPDRIILYIAKEDNELITDELRELEAYGVEIIKNVEDLKSHKKYFYVMQEYPEDIVITVDDDVLYEEKLLEHLYASYKRYPNAVSCKRAHKMTRKEDGSLESYIKWKSEYTEDKEPTYGLMAVGVGGVLYPPHCLSKEAFQKETFMELTPTQDDIWLKFIELKNSTKVVYVEGEYIHPPIIPHTQEQALYKINNGENVNDQCIDRLQEKFQLNLNDYCSPEEKTC
ncbi:MAG: glycosyltransferase [Lachnospiraceae bacterium]|nr:glycosyltransferase [Lachnospiraceae bacterium]